MALRKVNGKKVHVIEMNPAGQETVIMVHGMFTGLSVYYFQIAPLLAERYRVVLYDLRGHGLSEQHDDDFSLQVLSEDLFALMKALCIEKAKLVGYSFGAAIALCAALREPGIFEQLALIEAPLLHEPLFGRFPMTDAEFEDMMAPYIAAAEINVPKVMQNRFLARWREVFAGERIKESLAAGRRFFEETPPEGLTVPTLLLYGEQSEFLETGRFLQRCIPRVCFASAQGDHNLPVVQGLWISSRLETFFERT